MNYKILSVLVLVLLAAAMIAFGFKQAATRQMPVESAVIANDSNKTAAGGNKKSDGDSKLAASSDDVYNGEKIEKTEAEWRKELTPDRFYVLREKGTERAFTGNLTDNHEEGDYYCAACHLKLFSSKAKFESGTGWPSFYQPIAAANVTIAKDDSAGMSRDEVVCSRCHSHLGHVFDDGPQPTGLRYCMNSVALTFEKKK